LWLGRGYHIMFCNAGKNESKLTTADLVKVVSQKGNNGSKNQFSKASKIYDRSGKAFIMTAQLILYFLKTRKL
jgi:Ca2+-binding EF-hand superfamily protein